LRRATKATTAGAELNLLGSLLDLSSDKQVAFLVCVCLICVPYMYAYVVYTGRL
jgi:hypothetical protein